ncbi:MAG TPA: hypothetical protein VFQ65_20460 [Kofleriaceae bacterium]|nr:hypothetical protein [Kofleriaceae bacterium]
MRRALLFALAAGCTPVDSNVVATAKLRADVQVLATGTGGSTVSAWLFSHKDGDPPLNLETIRLVDDDAISVTSNDSSVAMTEVDLGVEYRYDAAFATSEPAQRYLVALARGSDRSAPDSHVTLPEPFTLTAPAIASRAAPLTIKWTGSGSDQISLAITGCASGQLGPLADTGIATFPAGAVVADPSDATCDLSIEVSRTRSGTLDPAYGQGGSIVAIQRRAATLTRTP